MKRLLIPLMVAVLVCLAVSAVAEGDRFAFDSETGTVNEGETLQSILYREGAAAEGDVIYTSSDSKVATVDENGLITGIKKGRVTITAAVKTTVKTFKALLKLTVNRPVTSITVKTDKLSVYNADDEKVAGYLTIPENAEDKELPVLLLPVKKKIQLTIAAEPKDATNRNVITAGSNDDVFTVSKNTISGIAPGEGVLTITSESDPEVFARYRVLVIRPVTKLTVSSDEKYVTVGSQMTVSAQAVPEDATMQQVTWSSGDERILTVDQNGTVTGVKRGNGRVIATTTDGSNIRANYTVKVVQNPESLTINQEEVWIDAGRTLAVRATILPKDTDNKKVIWSSSDESIAKVSKDGRIQGITKGDCIVTCQSEALENVSASVTVHVQQPVKKISFNDKSANVFVGETTQLTWTVEPEDASNPVLAFTSSNSKILSVDENGLVTGIGSGKANINAVTTDGSKRKATIGIVAGRHVEGVTMRRKHAYIDVGESARAGVVIEPKDALNKKMTWISSDESIVSTSVDKNGDMHLKGANIGDASVTGTTVDGGFQATLPVTVGDFDHGLNYLEFNFDDKGNFWLKVRNDTNLVITQITAELYMCNALDGDNPPVPINTKDGSNKVEIIWTGTLNPGETTGKNHWKMVNYQLPEGIGIYDTRGSVTVCSYQIDHDWIKTIRQSHRKPKDY